MIKLLVLVFAVLAVALSQEMSHSMINLDNMLPTQLTSILKGDWKSMLTNELQKQISSFKKPWHQET